MLLLSSFSSSSLLLFFLPPSLLLLLFLPLFHLPPPPHHNPHPPPLLLYRLRSETDQADSNDGNLLRFHKKRSSSDFLSELIYKENNANKKDKKEKDNRIDPRKKILR